MDIDYVIDLTKGIIHVLPHLKDGSYVWKEYGDVTTGILNN